MLFSCFFSYAVLELNIDREIDMNKKDDRIKKMKLTNHTTYSIIENTIYLFQDDCDIDLEELNIAMKKISLLVSDKDISYINISGNNMEKRKDFYRDLGFTLSYYDINRLNKLYYGRRNKIEYRCYGLMTKNDFFERMEKKETCMNRKEKIAGKKNVVSSSNSGYVNNFLLLFGGILLLCYFCVQGAIYLVK